MVNINISLTEEAYNYLKMLKGKDKSFSDVVIEMKKDCNKGNGKSLLKYAGVLKDKGIDWDEKEKRMKEFREGFNMRIESTRKEMRKNDRN